LECSERTLTIELFGTGPASEMTTMSPTAVMAIASYGRFSRFEGPFQPS